MPQYDVTFTQATGSTPSQVKVRWAPRVGLPKVCPMALERPATKAEPRRWLCPLPDSPAIVKWAQTVGYSVDPEVARYAEALWALELHALALSSAASIPEHQRSAVTGLTATLLDTQWVAVHMAANAWTRQPTAKTRHRALLIADEPGLGKTIEALAALRIEGLESRRAVVLCPSDLTGNWEAEVLQHFEEGTFRPWVATGKTPTPIPDDVDVVVIGWAIIADWVDTLIDWKPDALVADEGHFAKSGKVQTKTETLMVRNEDGTVKRDSGGNVVMEKVKKKVSGSTRADAGIRLGAAVAKAGGLAVALTGTPIVNRPVELVALLEMIGALAPFGSQKAIKERFCDPQQVNRGRGQRPATSYEGASNLLELNTRLRASGHYLRRRKKLLVDQGLLQPKYINGVDFYDYRTPHRPWMVQVTPEEMQAYWDVESEHAEHFAQVALDLSAELRAGITSKKVQEKVRATGARELSRIADLRKAAALVKAPHVIERVRGLNAQGERAVIAAHHREVVDLYADAFSGLKIQGGMGVRKIEAAKAAFNERPIEEHPVLVLSVEAGKMGHTLCKQEQFGVGPACAQMFSAEQVWVPGDESQFTDRIWRIGQPRPVHVTDTILPKSVDEQVYGTRQQKRRVVDEAVDAVTAADRRRASLVGDRAEKDGAGMVALNLALGRLERARSS